MKYSEAEKQIKALSSKYRVNEFSGSFDISYSESEIAYVSYSKRYSYCIWNKRYFSKLPFSNKLYMILSELAMTPLDERVEEKKYQVKAFGNYLNIRAIDNYPSINTSYDNSAIHTKFTLKEIEQLKQRNDIPLDWNKVKLEEVD